MKTVSKPTINDEMLCQQILVLLKQFKAIMATVADSYGMTPMQLGTLHAISDGHGTMGKVAQTMHCDASNVTGIIDRLVAMQMVTRQESENDRRVKVLAMTARGKAVLDKVLEELPGGLGCERLDDADRTAMHKAMNKLSQI